jgi:hypothetical protein
VRRHRACAAAPAVGVALALLAACGGGSTYGGGTSKKQPGAAPPVRGLSRIEHLAEWWFALQAYDLLVACGVSPSKAG